jgi:hypothetical protein
MSNLLAQSDTENARILSFTLPIDQHLSATSGQWER